TVKNSRHKVTAIEETLNKTTLGNWQTGQIVNLERCLKINSRLDGHIVQGHVDVTGICTATIEKAGSWEFRFEFPVEFAELIIEKGSITVNGISLTAYDVTNNSFSVAIIPYTFEHTNINMTKPDKLVNLEFDIIGKYISRKNKLTL
ncbi:MAG: riboflavin synthase, partial [Chitinophagaceae bacterium]